MGWITRKISAICRISRVCSNANTDSAEAKDARKMGQGLEAALVLGAARPARRNSFHLYVGRKRRGPADLLFAVQPGSRAWERCRGHDARGKTHHRRLPKSRHGRGTS